jgi:hypothetical protein
MHRRRFGLTSILVMLSSAVLATFSVVRWQDDQFSRHQGDPLTWHIWSDQIIEGRVVYEYRWWSLAADIAFWIAIVSILGILTETLCRLFRDGFRNAA